MCWRFLWFWEVPWYFGNLIGYNGSVLGLTWASYRENLSRNLSVTPPISMCDQLIYQTCVLLPYWLIFSSEPLKIQLTIDLCKETIYWFTLCVICWKTLKKCYSWLALHVNIVQWTHCKPFSKHGTRALPTLLKICQDGNWQDRMNLLTFLALVNSFMMYLGKEYFAYNMSTPTPPHTSLMLLLLLACKSLYDTKNSCLGSQTRLMVIRVEDNEPSFC
jgi:hypothetical protein